MGNTIRDIKLTRIIGGEIHPLSPYLKELWNRLSKVSINYEENDLSEYLYYDANSDIEWVFYYNSKSNKFYFNDNKLGWRFTNEFNIDINESSKVLKFILTEIVDLKIGIFMAAEIGFPNFDDVLKHDFSNGNHVFSEFTIQKDINENG